MQQIFCFAFEVDDQIIHAHDVCRGCEYGFDRGTGRAVSGFDEDDHGVIDSVAPLPEVQRAVLLRMYERYRNAQSEEDFRLTDSERQALLFMQSFYAEYRLA